MQLNPKAIEKVLHYPRLLNLVISKEPLSDHQWGLDDLTTAQIEHVQEIYKRNPNLVQGYINSVSSSTVRILENFSKLNGYKDAMMLKNEFGKHIYKIDIDSAQIKLEEIYRIKSKIQDSETIDCYNILISQCERDIEQLKMLCNSEISLLEKLLLNCFSSKANFWVVPGDSDKKCIILLEGGFHEDNVSDIVTELENNGFGGSFLIGEGYGFGVLSHYLIKIRNVSAYLQNTSSWGSSDAYENLQKSWLSEEDIKFMMSIPFNHNGDDAEWIYKDQNFLNRMKPVKMLLK